MLPPELKQEILDILARQWRGGSAPEAVQRLADMNQTLLLGDDPLIQDPDDIRKGAVLKIISRAQMDKVLAPHTYGQIELAVEVAVKREREEKKAISKPSKQRKASGTFEAPKKLTEVEIRVSESRTVKMSAALVDAIGSKKYAILAIAGTLTTDWYTEEGLKSLVEQGKLMASESSIKKAIRDFKENPEICEGLHFQIRESDGTEKYRILPE